MGYVIGIISHYKPVNELLLPILKDQQSAFFNQFAGMASIEFTYNEYEKIRIDLIDGINKRLTKDEKVFLLSFEMGEPDWELFPLPKLKDLPAIKWKLFNIQKLKKENLHKHNQKVLNLKNTLGLV